MNILYYVPQLSKAYGGAYQYAIALLKILTKDSENRYYILNTDGNSDIRAIIEGKGNFSLIPEQSYLFIDRPTSLYTRLRLSYKVRSKTKKRHVAKDGKLFVMLDEYGIDVIHSPYQTIPACGLPMVSTMHDVQELHFPHFFSSADRAFRAVHYKYVIDNSARVVVSYDHIKNDIVRFFGKAESSIHTILLDMENLWIDKFKGVQAGALPDNLPKRFLLYPAATWEHKNHLALIKAVHYLKQTIGYSVQIVCTGNKTSYFAVLEDHLRSLEVVDNFHFLGIVDDSTLYSLYEGAHGVVVPTLYEAGSFPLMESILLHRPVICSNVTSLPETMDAAEFIFDPCNITQLADLMFKLCEDNDFRARNLMKVNERSKTIRFNNSLMKVRALYQSVFDNQGAILSN